MVNVETLTRAYGSQFPGSRPRWVARAPGRVNLIGEHVDYNNGLVLPAAIERSTCVVIGPGRANTVSVHSDALNHAVDINIEDNPPPNPPTWDSYIRGVIYFLKEAGVRVPGANLYVETDVPVGSGLSSSASLEISTALALLAFAGETLPIQQVVSLCKRAEHVYARVPCGMMDQTASALSLAGSAMLLDCRDGNIRHIPWPSEDVAILVVDCQVEHRLVDSPYGQRVHECSQAVEQIRAMLPEIHSLRDVPPAKLSEFGDRLDKTLLKRARHVVTEIQRTADAAAALERGDFSLMGRLMKQSHESLRDDYEVSTSHLDELARLLWETPAVYGARVTGGGFGGSVVAIVRAADVRAIENVIRQRYDVKQKRPARLIVTRPAAGASVTPL